MSSIFIRSTANIRWVFVALSVVLFSSANAQGYNTQAANQFASLFKQHRQLTPESLEEYLNLESEGMSIFKDRIKSTSYLAQAINENPDLYQRAIDVCLPVANQMEVEAQQLLDKVNQYLDLSETMSVSILFGAANTGGTVNENGIAIALEMICQLSETPEQAKQVLVNYIVHEVTHVYQFRFSKIKDLNFSLLKLSLLEGTADFIAHQVLGDAYQVDADRVAFGTKHEALLWSEFSKVMHKHQYAPWLYSPKVGERPIDLGYWVGMQIAEAYVDKNQGNKQALHKLLRLKDAEQILAESGYSPKKRNQGCSF